MRPLRLLGCAMCLLSFFSKQASSCADCDKEPSVKGPVVHGPVTPQSSDAPAPGQAPAPKWKPGDRVRVRPDLKKSRQTDSESAVEPPASTPQEDDRR